MRAAGRDEARRQPGSGVATRRTSRSVKVATGRAELQGLRTGRHPDQRPPTWDLPAGWATANELELAMRNWRRP